MSPVPQIQKVQPLMKSRLFAIEAVDLLFENGQACTFERLVGQGEGAVMVVPVLSPERLLVVREYAVGVERYELGFVKGRIDAGESPEEAARRELREEIGLDARRLDILKTVSLTPAYSNYRTHLFMARELFPAPLAGDEPEPLEIIEWPTGELARLREASDFTDARSVLATYLFEERMAI